MIHNCYNFTQLTIEAQNDCITVYQKSNYSSRQEHYKYLTIIEWGLHRSFYRPLSKRNDRQLRWSTNRSNPKAQRGVFRNLQAKKIQQDLNNPNLSHITGNDGTVTFFDENGNVVKQTDPGIGPSAKIANEKFVNPETSSQIADVINNRSLTNAKLTYDKNLGYSDAVTGDLADKEEVYKIQKFNNSINADVMNYMNAKKVYAPEAYDKIVAAHAFNAAERALKSNNPEEIKTLINQYPTFMRPQIQEMMKRLNAAQSNQMNSLEIMKAH